MNRKNGSATERKETLTFNRYSFWLIGRLKENTCEFRDGFSQTNLLKNFLHQHITAI